MSRAESRKNNHELFLNSIVTKIKGKELAKAGSFKDSSLKGESLKDMNLKDKSLKNKSLKKMSLKNKTLKNEVSYMKMMFEFIKEDDDVDARRQKYLTALKREADQNLNDSDINADFADPVLRTR